MNLRRKPSVIAAALLSGTLLAGVTTTGAACKSPRFGNRMSTSQEVQIGQQAKQEIESKERILTSGPQAERLQRVAARIIPLAQRDYNVPYSVKLIDSEQINAFALPGGPIYFYKGLVDLAATDDELASVVGHEAAHVVKRHSARQISDAQGKGLLAQVFLGRSSNIVQTLASIGLQLDQLRFSRDDESQSDEVGFKYLVEAGYDPNAMASFFRRMAEKSKSGGPEWLRSHPLTSKRVEQAEQRARAYNQGRTAANR